jgi:hypothetical protein
MVVFLAPFGSMTLGCDDPNIARAFRRRKSSNFQDRHSVE